MKSKVSDPESPRRVVALAGGVGGAKLADGLQSALGPGELSVVVNTADDFKLWSLYISPDVDTVMYTLAGIANREWGWGIEGDTWNALDMVARYGVDAWFRLGDRDFATHVLRTHMLSEGPTLTEATRVLSTGLGVTSAILPMCDEPVESIVETAEGPLGFQDYFVRRRHADEVSGVTFRGIEQSRPTSAVLDALSGADAIIFNPSNPIVSIGPILAVPGMKAAIAEAPAVKVAVSPIVGGEALKGPAAGMLRSLGHEVSAAGVAALYRGIINGMVIDTIDAGLAGAIRELGIEVEITDTIMKSPEDREALAQTVLRFCGRLASTVGEKTKRV